MLIAAVPRCAAASRRPPPRLFLAPSTARTKYIGRRIDIDDCRGEVNNAGDMLTLPPRAAGGIIRDIYTSAASFLLGRPTPRRTHAMPARPGISPAPARAASMKMGFRAAMPLISLHTPAGRFADYSATRHGIDRAVLMLMNAAGAFS